MVLTYLVSTSMALIVTATMRMATVSMVTIVMATVRMVTKIPRAATMLTDMINTVLTAMVWAKMVMIHMALTWMGWTSSTVITSATAHLAWVSQLDWIDFSIVRASSSWWMWSIHVHGRASCHWFGLSKPGAFNKNHCPGEGLNQQASHLLSLQTGTCQIFTGKGKQHW